MDVLELISIYPYKLYRACSMLKVDTLDPISGYVTEAGYAETSRP